MYQNNKFINKNEFSYEDLKQIEEHAKKYDSTSDKKAFLKGITPYEQKLVLLASEDPYEVLMYLDELDMKNSRLVLNNLEADEIVKIIDMFTSENKKNFYTVFSDLELVNQFMVYDKNASQHIKNIDTERKIELLNSSDNHTLKATSKLYDSLQEEEKTAVVHGVTSTEGVLALNEATSYVEDKQEVEEQEKVNEEEKNEEIEIKEEVEEQEKVNEEEKNEKIEIKEEPAIEESVINEFFVSKKDYYKSIIPELKDMLDISFALLSDDIKQTIISDYKKSKLNPKESKEEKKLEQEITPKSDEFHKIASDCEQELINSVLEKVTENQNENEVTKTL